MDKKENKRRIYVEKGRIPEERVNVFGEDWADRYGKRHGNIVFGFMLITGGIILLFNTAGILPWTVWDYIWRFWPLLLILWGLQIILGVNKVSILFFDLVSIILVIMVALFAIYQVNPGFMALPGQLTGLFTLIRKGMFR